MNSISRVFDFLLQSAISATKPITSRLFTANNARKGLYAILISSVGFGLYILAVLLYICVYWWYVPASTVSVPIYFEYPNNMVDVKQVMGTLDFSLNRYTDGPFKLARSVLYSVSLELEMPRDQYNNEIGNFMVTLSTTSESGAATSPPALLGTSVYTRPAILPYKSPVLELLDTLFFLPLYLTKFWQQTSVLTIPLARNVASTSIIPSSGRDTLVWLDRPVNIVQASLIINTQWQGLRAWMYHYRLLLFVVAPVAIWIIEAIVAAVVAYLVVDTFGSEPSSSQSNQPLIYKEKPSQRQQRNNKVTETPKLDEDDVYPSPAPTPAHYNDIDDETEDDNYITTPPPGTSTVSSESFMDVAPTTGTAPTTPWESSK